MQQMHLDITSDPVEMAPTRKKVEAFCTAAGFDARETGNVGLCLNEALANITRHAYGGVTDRPVRIDAMFNDDRLEIKIRDWGNGRDPSSLLPKRDPLTPGGLGLICLRSLMDEIKFEKQDVGMLLTLLKSRSGGK